VIMILWHSFKHRLPRNGTTIIVEDHEENHSVGVWHTSVGYESIDNYPIGIILKWSPITIVMYSDIQRTCKMFYQDQTEIDVDALYDEEPLFKQKE
jgi:hypothetical protein